MGVMSRQREYQRKMRAQHRCIICGGPEHVSCYCEKHYKLRMEKIRARSEVQGTPKTCSLCSGEGHNKRTCPEREGGRRGLVESLVPA